MVIPTWQDLKNNLLWTLWEAFLILVVGAIRIAALAVGASLTQQVPCE